MTRSILDVGNPDEIIFDAELMASAQVKVGDQFDVRIADNGAIILTPVRPESSKKASGR